MMSPEADFKDAILMALGAVGFFHALKHCTDVAVVSRELNALIEVQPVVIGAVTSNSLGIIPGLPECSKCLL